MEYASPDALDPLLAIFPFSLLGEDGVAACLPYCEFLECRPGTKVFSVGKRANHFYFVLNGEVELRTSHERAALNNGVLKAGDHFGAEVLHPHAVRKARAVCTAQTTLVAISRQNLARLMAMFPEFADAMRLFAQSYQLASEQALPWLLKGESLLLMVRRHKFIPVLRVIAITVPGTAAFLLLLTAAFASETASVMWLVFALLALLLVLLLDIWAVAEWANDMFLITSGRVVAQRQMYGFFESRQESPLSAILSTAYDSSLFGRLIGFGTVSLKSYTGEIAFRKLPYPQTIFDFLEQLRQRAADERVNEERKQMAAHLAGRLGNAAPERPEKPGQSSPSMIYQGGSLLDWMARFFQLRQEKDNSIVYRTHWWIMVKKTMLPGLLMLLLFAGFVGRALGFFGTMAPVPFYVATLALTLIVALWWFYQYLDWYNDQYILTGDQLIDLSRKPLGYEDRRSMPVKNIQTVEFKRKGIIGLMLNYGTVHIQVGNEQLTFDDVYAPSQVQGEIYAHLRHYQEQQQRMEGQRMADWISTYDRIKQGQPPEDAQPG
jgi:hypothetical protein